MTRMSSGDEREPENSRLVTAFTISCILHLVFFSALLYLQYRAAEERREFTAIDVSLVALPGPGSPEKPDKDMEELSVPEPEPEPIPEDTPEKPKAPEKKAPPEIKEPQKVPDKPVEKKKKPEEEKPKKQLGDFEKTLERLRKQVQEGPPSDLYKRSGPGRFGPGDGDYGAPLSAREQYLVEVVTIIRQNWSFTPQLIRERGKVKTYVALTIETGGVISDIMIDRGSISSYFDDTVIKAIEKSSPLPPVPMSVDNKALRIGLAFTPEGIE